MARWKLPSDGLAGVRWNRIPVGLALVLLVVLSVIAVVGWLARLEPSGVMDDRRFGDYRVRVYRDERGVTLLDRGRALLPAAIRRRLPGTEDRLIAGVEVRHRGRLVYQARGALFHLPDSDWGWWDRRQPGVTPGADVNGDGTPNLVIYEWSGEMRDPAVVHVFEAGARLRRIAEIEGYDPQFEDVDGDGVYEVVLIDGLFRFDAVFGLPSVRVILRWSTGGYRVAQDLMRRPEPEPEAWDEMIRRTRASNEWQAPSRYGGVPQQLFGEALALMYGGHEGWGWRLLREGWKPGSEVDERMLDNFREQRDRSRYWQELADLNPGLELGNTESGWKAKGEIRDEFE